jgi:hypothetical protein
MHIGHDYDNSDSSSAAHLKEENVYLIRTPGIFQTEKETVEIEEERPAPSSFLLIGCLETAKYELAFGFTTARRYSNLTSSVNCQLLSTFFVGYSREKKLNFNIRKSR